MGLSCYCDEYPEPGDTYWQTPHEYSILKTKKGKRCRSCGTLIKPGSIVGEFERFKSPDYDIEVAIYGEDGEIPRASHYLCEECMDVFFSLDELKFCVSPYEDQRELAKEYAAFYGPGGIAEDAARLLAKLDAARLLAKPEWEDIP